MQTYLETQELSTLLEQAAQEGAVRIRRDDGRMFVLQPEAQTLSPLDVPGVDIQLSAEEITAFIHEGRKIA